MKNPSLYNFYREKMAEANLQQSYNMAVFAASYRTDNNHQRGPEPIARRIECGSTRCRLEDDSAPAPNNIERCG